MASSTFYGAAYLHDPIGPSKSLEPLRTALSACLVPRTNRSKSTTVALAVIAKAHLCEPLTAFRYHAIRTFLRMYQKDSVASRIDALVIDGAGSMSFGPVGIATRILRLLGFSWTGEGLSVIQLGNRQFSPKDPSALAPLLHEVREALRKLTFREIESKRNGFSGIADGVDVSRVNVLWQKSTTSPVLASAIRRCLAGAVYSREWCSIKWGNCEPQCEHCSTGATGSLDHYYWSCPHWDSIRTRFSDVTSIAASLPDCLRLRGIPTRETERVTRRVQYLLGSITHAMSRAQRALVVSKPWHLPRGRTTVTCTVYGEHDAFLKKLLGDKLHCKMCSWLKELRWVPFPALPVTCVELALDFEAHGGWRLPGATLAEKGVQIGALLRAFNEVGLLQDRPVFVGRWRQGVCSLRCFGAPPMPGISHRPAFAAEAITVLALNNISASCQGREWSEIKPSYGSPLAGRKQYQLKTKPKALASAIAKYVSDVKRGRDLANARKERRTHGPSSAAPTRPSALPPAGDKRRDDTRPP